MTDPWTLWRNDVFGDPYMVWHEGPDFRRLLQLAKTAPAEVAQMLTAGVGAGDDVAAGSFAALADAGLAPRGAEALLRTALPAATGAFRIRVVQALHRLTGDESWATPIASVLASKTYWGDRIDAAMALAGFAPTPELIEVLAQGVCDADYLVRYHSANTLLRYAGRAKKDIYAYRTLFNKIAGPREGETSKTYRAKRREVADQLTEEALRRLG
jgi:hypothetical protein